MVAENEEQKAFDKLNASPQLLVPPGLREAMTPEQLQQCAKDILAEYTNGKPLSRESLPDFLEVSRISKKDPAFTRLLNPSPTHLSHKGWEGKGTNSCSQ